MTAKWIWLNPARYPTLQETIWNIGLAHEESSYAVVEFEKEMTFDKKPAYVELRVSGDTHFRLFADGEWIGMGPAAAGGDFLATDAPLDWYYQNPYRVMPKEKTLHLFAQVQLSPQVLTEFSRGQGGFYLNGTAVFEDGQTMELGTDAAWRARLNRRYCAPCTYDETLSPDAWEAAFETGDTRVLSDAPVRMLEFETVLPMDAAQRRIAVHAGERIGVEFDRIYAANIALHASGACELRIACHETPGVGRSGEHVTFQGEGEYRSFRMHSVGECEIEVIRAAEGAEIELSLVFNHYPIDALGTLKTSDPELDAIFDLCRWTLGICRQTIHLDSPMHQELLACTGDYYIETLMSIYTCGDMSLARGDVIRTANWLRQNSGRMFHTTYSLIWVQMLELVHQLTADEALLWECRDALQALFARFDGYIGENGVIDQPPDYMFVDWVVVDGYSMHHPPKYLGQTVLNAFYYKALCVAAQIGARCGWEEADAYAQKAAALKIAFNKAFYDQQTGFYIDGLADFVPETKWQPENPPKRHISRHANLLAALYELCDEQTAVRLIHMAAHEQAGMAPIQPYFMCFMLQAVEKYGLVDVYGMQMLKLWSASVKACSKGLQEGWYKPEESYSFDHSHAWGGCPAYFIPQFLTGMKMEKPGFKEITLSPRLYGLKTAEIAFPTPRGEVKIVLREGEAPRVQAPDSIRWKLRE